MWPTSVRYANRPARSVTVGAAVSWETLTEAAGVWEGKCQRRTYTTAPAAAEQTACNKEAQDHQKRATGFGRFKHQTLYTPR
jgi:hypothetical protein